MRRDQRRDETGMDRRLGAAGQPFPHGGRHQGRAPRSHLLTLLLVCSAVMGGALVGCSGDTTGPTPLAPAQTYWALRLNYHAVNLALTADSTVQLTATTLNVAGSTLTGAGVVTYSTSDTNITVSLAGLVVARHPTSLTAVIATLQYHTVTHTDTAFIQVTGTAPSSPLATFSIQPAAGDSAKTTVNYSGSVGPAPYSTALPVYATNTAGGTVCDTTACPLLVDFSSSDPTIATTAGVSYSSGVTPLRIGQVTIYATTLAYGIEKHDSLRYTIGYPLDQIVNIVSSTPVASLTPQLTFDPAEVTVAVGGVVEWANQNIGNPIDVVFDSSASVDTASAFYGIAPPTGSGNIPAFALDTSVSDTVLANLLGIRGRRFPVAGTYHYHSMLYPSSAGVIYVKHDLQ